MPFIVPEEAGADFAAAAKFAVLHRPERAVLSAVQQQETLVFPVHGGHEIMEIFSQLWKGGRTILMVTHDPAIAAFSKSTIHLLDGTVQADCAAH